MKLIGEKKTKVDWLDKVRKKDLTKNEFEGGNDRALTYDDDSDRLTLFRMDMSFSRSSISESVRFCQKFKFQVRGEKSPRMDEIGEFWIDETL